MPNPKRSLLLGSCSQMPGPARSNCRLVSTPHAGASRPPLVSRFSCPQPQANLRYVRACPSSFLLCGMSGRAPGAGNLAGTWAATGEYSSMRPRGSCSRAAHDGPAPGLQRLKHQHVRTLAACPRMVCPGFVCACLHTRIHTRSEEIRKIARRLSLPTDCRRCPGHVVRKFL